MKPDPLSKWQSTDIAEHTRAQIARDLMQREPDPVRDEFCEAVESVHGAAWIALAALVCAAVALVWGVM